MGDLVPLAEATAWEIVLPDALVLPHAFNLHLEGDHYDPLRHNF